MDLTKYIIGYSPEFIENGDSAYIDIAIEFDLQLFRALKLGCEPDENGYVHNELGSFYYNGIAVGFGLSPIKLRTLEILIQLETSI